MNQVLFERCFFILMIINFDVGVLLFSATLSIGTKTFVSG